MADDRWMWWATPPPRSFPASEYTTGDEMRQERVSQALGWDTTRPGREFGMRALMQLPLALRTPAGATRMNAAVATEGRAFDDYINAFGYPPAPGMSVDAMRRWVDWRRGGTQAQPLRPSSQVRSGGPTQGQRDLYELTPATNPHEARAMMEDLNHRSMLDPVRSQRFWDAPDLHSARPSSVLLSNAPQRGPTQPQRDFHELNPRYQGFEYDAAANRGMSNPNISDAALDAMWGRHLSFNRALREFENLPRPPNNRLNALLPFAGAAGAFAPDEPY